MKAYCVKCKKIVDIKNEYESKDGRSVKGICPKCGTKLNRFIKKKK